MIGATEIIKTDNKEDGIWYQFNSLVNGNTFENYTMFVEDETEYENTVYVWGAAGNNTFYEPRKEFKNMPEAEKFASNYLSKVRTNFLNNHKS